MATAIVPYPKFKGFVPGTNTPLVGGLLYAYLSGTSTQTSTYTDVSGLTPNAWPVVLDANGEADVWINGQVKLVLRDSLGVQIWSKDNIGNPQIIPSQISIGNYSSLTTAVAAIGSTPTTLIIDNPTTLTGNTVIPTTLSLQFIYPGTVAGGGFTLILNGRLNAGLYQIFSGGGAVTFASGYEVYPEWWGNDAVAFQAALDAGRYNSYSGVHVKTQKGKTYTLASTLLIRSKKLLLDGGGLLHFTGTGDGIQSTWGTNGNGNTAINLTVRDMVIYNDNGSNVGAAIADIGGVYINIDNNYFLGFKYSIILDQSELVRITNNVIEGFNFAGIWICGDAAHTPGAIGGYTNQIVIEKNAFNGTSTTNNYSILDDGGQSHIIQNNNFENAGTHIRVTTGPWNAVIAGNEMEGSFVSNITTSLYSLLGRASYPCTSLVIRDNNMLNAGSYNVNIGPSSVLFLTFTGNHFYTYSYPSSSLPINALTGGPYNILAYGNVSEDETTGLGALTYANWQARGYSSSNYVAYNNSHLSETDGTANAWVPQWTAQGSNPAIGNGNISHEYSRNGTSVTVTATITMGNSTTYGTGQWQVSLPISEKMTKDWVGSVSILDTSTSTIYTGVAILNPLQSSVKLNLNNDTTGIDSTHPITWDVGDALAFSITYSVPTTQ